jgi:NADH:ubiquinone oxidoreductase subunit E
MATVTADKAKVDELKAYIAEHKGIKGPLMPIIQKAQEIFGCLPIDVQDVIAEEMAIPMTDIYGVATFYSQFALEPKGEHVIGLCMGTACYVKNSQPILERLRKELGISEGSTTTDRKFSLDATRCLGCCGLAPVMVIDDRVYGRLKPEDIPGILAEYK